MQQISLMKEIGDNTNMLKDILCSWNGIINIVKMTIRPKAVYRLNAIPYQNTKGIFQSTGTNNFKICMETQKTQIGTTILRKKDRGRGIMLSDFSYITTLQ